MAQKYYAVRKGRQPGIYRTWPETQKQVSGFSGAQYKSFASATEAKAFMQGTAGSEKPVPTKGRRQPATRSQPAQPSNQLPVTITVYTDGGSRNTGNVAGGHVKTADKAAWAYRIELPDRVVTGSDGEFGATNNRMEIMAFLNALKRLESLGETATGIRFVLDSQYVLNAVTKGWLAGWKRRGWKRSAGPLVNAELWQAVDRLLPQFTGLTFAWTKGHATNQGNVFVDHLLNQTMDQMVPGQATPKTSTDTQVEKPDLAKTDSTHQSREQSVADIARNLQDLPFSDD
ncbi:ribonuclease H family protein [Levilactobacillus tongjiangensis]|uniref:ribonuclease H n=1 Tax=Levilactobacillus tongjiangensis TaxID=2486023 RepID=A0ABW1SR56_9LACO|nr:ribonuclease H family protein [Levilactobacillus tongjiangensis]